MNLSKEEERVIRRFDRLCQMALKGEAINYYRHMDYRRKNEVMLSELSETGQRELCVLDEYSVEDDVFLIHGYEIRVKDPLLAEAIKGLTRKKREVILLSYFMEMSDAEIARELHLVQSTVHVHHKRSLELLKKMMEQWQNE